MYHKTARKNNSFYLNSVKSSSSTFILQSRGCVRVDESNTDFVKENNCLQLYISGIRRTTSIT